MQESSKVVYAAIAANAALAAAKFLAAAVTGSSAMLAEGIHSVVDSLNEVLLLLGLHRSRRPPDREHPFGHGKELYFWSLIVAIVLFGVGAGMALYEGVTHLMHPQPLENAAWSYGVLAFAALFEGISFAVAFRTLGAGRDGGNPARWWRRVRRSKDPSIFTVFLEDLAALVGLLAAFCGTLGGHLLHNPYLDGAASVVIGLVLGSVALMLASESRGLLVGESALPEVVQRIRQLIESDPRVLDAGAPQTMQLSPDTLLVVDEIQFDPSIPAAERLRALEQLTEAIRGACPQAVHISLQPTRHGPSESQIRRVPEIP